MIYYNLSVFFFNFANELKKTKHIVNAIVWTLIGVYTILIVLSHIPAIQRFIGTQAGELLSDELDTKVQIGKVDVGFFNRLIIDDVNIYDQRQRMLLNAKRISAKISITDLFQDKVTIKSAQLFGCEALLNQQSKDTPANFQFIIDKLSGDNEKEKKPLNLQINSLVIRNGRLSYHRMDVAPTPQKFNINHFELNRISAHIILDKLTDSMLDLNVKRMSMEEKTGLTLKALAFRLEADERHAVLKDFTLELPNTLVKINKADASYQKKGTQIETSSLRYNGSINNAKFTLSDISAFVPALQNFVNPIYIYTDVLGTGTSLYVKKLLVNSAQNSISLNVSGMMSKTEEKRQWAADIKEFKLSAEDILFLMNNLGPNLHLPQQLTRLGNIGFSGTTSGDDSHLTLKGNLRTDAGNATLSFAKQDDKFKTSVQTDGIMLGHILEDHHFGFFAAEIEANGALPSQARKSPTVYTKGKISRFEYNSYIYKNISIDGNYSQNDLKGRFIIDDPNAQIVLNGHLNFSKFSPVANFTLDVERLIPDALHLSDNWPSTEFAFHATADIAGKDLNTANGTLLINDFTMRRKIDDLKGTGPTWQNIYEMTDLNFQINNADNKQQLTFHSDFADLQVEGQYDYATLLNSISDLILEKLPTLPLLTKSSKKHNNHFKLNGTISQTNWLTFLAGLPIDIGDPIHIDGELDDITHMLQLNVSIPRFYYNGTPYEDIWLHVNTPGDSLHVVAHADKVMNNGKIFSLNLTTDAVDNHLAIDGSFQNHEGKVVRGQLKADAFFLNDDDGVVTTQIDFLLSDFIINDTTWNVRPSRITYRQNNLQIDDFAIVSCDGQHLVIDGRGSQEATDLINLDMKNVNVEYIMNLVNFHSVEFSGLATGKASIAGLFGKAEANARLTVNNFRFENGLMGTLYANASLNNQDEQIDLSAIIEDEDNRQTLVNGFVSPQHNTIDLNIKARRTRGEFLESFCGSFMRDVDVNITGDLRLYGPLSSINLVGNAIADGQLGIKQLGTTYYLHDIPIRLTPDEIFLENDTVRDRNGNPAVVNGVLHHKSLTRFTFDLGVDTDHFLSYDFRNFDGNTFCGTIYATGHSDIRGRNGEIIFDINATPTKGSVFSYNAASPEAIRTQDFIQWNTVAPQPDGSLLVTDPNLTYRMSVMSLFKDIPTDIRLNLDINATPDLALRILMNEQTGDDIILCGNGILRATYYNKGSFDIYGNYLIDHGTYKLTIQNVIKKDFHFQQGGTIIFGGDPYNAQLNLQALYTVNGVNLSDLNIGRSFTTNNIRVDCMMGITGTPNAPKVEFSLDMPTIGNDVKQMVLSLINSEDEMNQQVLYLLAIGRFYTQSGNNASNDGTTQQQSQSSLAMQSLLSGTISQQLNNVLSSVVNNNNWNFGANISTGTEGFYNAEYDGILSGRLLNNRLLINGQFGYRDNVNNPNSSSFIGDFDIRYILVPSGNIAIKVYNQTNDRYFTRNSLTTQGIGFIMKKDFNGLSDLFGIRKSRRNIPTDSIKGGK